MGQAQAPAAASPRWLHSHLVGLGPGPGPGLGHGWLGAGQPLPCFWESEAERLPDISSSCGSQEGNKAAR